MSIAAEDPSKEPPVNPDPDPGPPDPGPQPAVPFDLSSVYGPDAKSLIISLNINTQSPTLVVSAQGVQKAVLPLCILGPDIPSLDDIVAAFVPGQLIMMPAPSGPPLLAIIRPPVANQAVSVLAEAQLPAPGTDRPPAPAAPATREYVAVFRQTPAGPALQQYRIGIDFQGMTATRHPEGAPSWPIEMLVGTLLADIVTPGPESSAVTCIPTQDLGNGLKLCDVFPDGQPGPLLARVRLETSVTPAAAAAQQPLPEVAPMPRGVVESRRKIGQIVHTTIVTVREFVDPATGQNVLETRATIYDADGSPLGMITKTANL